MRLRLRPFTLTERDLQPPTVSLRDLLWEKAASIAGETNVGLPQYVEEIVSSGTHLERGVLSWCLQNSIPLREASDDWAVVTYEQLVVDPGPVIDELALKLELPAPNRIRDALTVPSVNVKIKSSEETQHLLYETTAERRPDLVDKWRRKVDAEEAARAMQILDVFDMDVYTTDVFPADWAWISSRAPLEGRPTDASRP